MKIGEATIQNLAKIICGDIGHAPRLSGPELVTLFNSYGFKDTYGAGFPTRWRYAEINIRELNEKPELKKLIEEIVDPRRYFSYPDKDPQVVANEINEFLKYDKYQLRKSGNYFKVTDLVGALIEPETSQSIGHEFVEEQIKKSQTKIIDGDYNGAITNARTLVEAVLIEILERHENKEVKNDGDVENLYRRVKKVLNLEIDRAALPDTVIQILSGLNSITSGLAGLSNSAADRHANKFKTSKHHAKLAVNSAMTLCEFLLDSMAYQKKS